MATKMWKPVGVGLALLVGAAVVWMGSSEESRQSLKREAMLKTAEVAGNLAEEVMERASDLVNVPVELEKVNDFTYLAKGIGNTYLIYTDEGYVLFDTGLGIQSAKQRTLLLELLEQEGRGGLPVHTIVASHSHADHIGGIKFWRDEGTEIVAHRAFVENQRYLTELEPYFHDRNRTMFPFMPEKPPEQGSLFAYGGVVPTVLVEDYKRFSFTLGGVEFEVIGTPAAEGDDNLVMWLPQYKMMFSGDSLGPMFPQFPNVFTMRGEKIRKPLEYVHSLDLYIELAPEMILPSHFEPYHGVEDNVAGLTRIRDAVQYVHNETVKGMNAGKSVHELMAQIQLPEHLDLTQGHGRVSWMVKSLWEYYATWFHFDSTTELYPVPAREVYADVVELAGTEALLVRAKQYAEQREYVHAIHLIEMVRAQTPAHPEALALEEKVLKSLKGDAEQGLNNTYEVMWLQRQLDAIERLKQAAENEQA